MLEIVSWFVVGFIVYILDCYVFSKLMKKKKFEITKKMLLVIIVALFIDYYVYIQYPKFIKLFVANIELCAILVIIYKSPVIKTIIATLFTYIIYSLTEIISVIILSILFPNASVENLLFLLLCNATTIAGYMVLMRNKRLIKIIQKIMNFHKDNELLNTIMLSFLGLALISSISYPIALGLNKSHETFIFLIFLIGAIVFITGYFCQKSKSDELVEQYDSLLQYMSEYEKALDEKSKRQHEYRNQLVMIKDMVSGKNKKVSQYIQELLNEEETKNIDLLNSLRYLPAGGIKGLIYYKAEKMIEEGMEVHINIAKALEKKKLWKTCVEELQDVSRVIGVYIDNAIEAARKAEKKYVIIDFEYEEEKIIVSFSNTYKGHIQLEKLDKQGYSTKGKNRGYGLPLVKEIIDKNELLSQEREMNGMFYVQKLIIKNK